MAALSAAAGGAGTGDAADVEVEDSMDDGVVQAIQDKPQNKDAAVGGNGNPGVSTCAACGQDSRT